MTQGTKQQDLLKTIIDYKFDYERIEVQAAIAKYGVWKEETANLIAQFISLSEAEKFRKIKAPEYFPKTLYDGLSAIDYEWKLHMGFLAALMEGLRMGQVEINTKEIQHKRYRVLHKLYELASNGRSDKVSIDDLAKALDHSFRETSDILIYWEEKGLVEATEYTVKLTAFGIDEIKETISHPEKPTQHFPPNIVNNYSINIQGANYGAIQQGGQNNTQNNTVNVNSTVNDATSKLIELIKASSLNELDKEEIINHAERVKDLVQKEQTPEVADRAKKILC
jgi:hypothetical protein